MQIDKVVAARLKREARCVVVGWHRIAHCRRLHKAVLHQSAARLHARCLRQAMQEWQYQTWKAVAMRRVAKFVQTHNLRPAFNTWKAARPLELAIAKSERFTTTRYAPCRLHYLRWLRYLFWLKRSSMYCGSSALFGKLLLCQVGWNLNASNCVCCSV